MNTTTNENKIKPGYKKIPLGIIPEDWNYIRISEIADIVGGGTPSTTNDDYWNGSINWFTPTEIKSKYVKSSNRKISQEGLKSSSAKLLPVNTILLTTRATIGEASIALEESSTNQGFQSLICKENTNVLFLYDLIRYYKNELVRRANGSTFLEISKKEIEKIKLPIPPLPEQKAIANCLSTWDKGIEKLTALIQSKKEQKKGLMQQIFNGQLKVDNGQLIQGKEGEDFIKNWKKVRINEISKLGRGRVISKKEIENNLGIYPVYSSQTTNNGVFGYLNTYDFEGEYITWTTDGVNAGSIFYRTGRFNCTNVCGTVKLKKGYDYYFVKSALNRVAERYVSRTLANPKLMNGVFGTIEIMIPSYDEQRSITKVLMDFDKEIELLEKKLDQFKTQKKGLMQVLLTGERRLINN